MECHSVRRQKGKGEKIEINLTYAGGPSSRQQQPRRNNNNKSDRQRSQSSSTEQLSAQTTQAPQSIQQQQQEQQQQPSNSRPIRAPMGFGALSQPDPQPEPQAAQSSSSSQITRPSSIAESWPVPGEPSFASSHLSHARSGSRINMNEFPLPSASAQTSPKPSSSASSSTSVNINLGNDPDMIKKVHTVFGTDSRKLGEFKSLLTAYKTSSIDVDEFMTMFMALSMEGKKSQRAKVHCENDSLRLWARLCETIPEDLGAEVQVAGLSQKERKKNALARSGKKEEMLRAMNNYKAMKVMTFFKHLSFSNFWAVVVIV
jgi:DNA uptake protein ComE-like DNA-binding protein